MESVGLGEYRGGICFSFGCLVVELYRYLSAHYSHRTLYAPIPHGTLYYELKFH